MNLLGMETHFAGDHRVIGVAVSAVVAAGGQNTVQQGSAGDNEIQLVPVTRSGVLEESLLVLVEFAYAKVADASGP